MSWTTSGSSSTTRIFGFMILEESSQRSVLQFHFSTVPNVVSFVKIDYFFGDIRSMVGNPFETLNDDHEVEAALDRVRLLGHAVRQIAVELLIDRIDLRV